MRACCLIKYDLLECPRPTIESKKGSKMFIWKSEFIYSFILGLRTSEILKHILNNLCLSWNCILACIGGKAAEKKCSSWPSYNFISLNPKELSQIIQNKRPRLTWLDVLVSIFKGECGLRCHIPWSHFIIRQLLNEEQIWQYIKKYISLK